MKIDIFLENSNQIQINLCTWKSILFLLQPMKEDGPELKSYDDHVCLNLNNFSVDSIQ